MTVYYNDNEAYAAQWLRNLIQAGLIPDGRVDERDIREVRADELAGYERCHFFAGIAGWELALQLAGWPADRPLWTGSCPCQPFSQAGRRQGFDDPRDLWPVWGRLIGECRPATVFGEQVGGRAGRVWLDRVYADLVPLGYAVGSADLPAASVGSPQIRQRLWWVADADGHNRGTNDTRPNAGADRGNITGRGGDPGGMADPRCHTRCTQQQHKQGGTVGRQETPVDPLRPQQRGAPGGLADAEVSERRGSPDPGDGRGRAAEAGGSGAAAGMGGADCCREGQVGGVPEGAGAERAGGAWDEFDYVWCRDGTYRRVEPGTFPLADGVPGRVGKLRAYGNAIVPQVAAEFVKAFLDTDLHG